MKDVKYYEKKIGLKPEYYFWDDQMTDKFKNDKRQGKWAEQREKYGFDQRELWCLKSTLATFIYPRLMLFSEGSGSFPLGMEYDEWLDIVKRMAKSFELILTEDMKEECDENYYKQIDEGLELFAKYFMQLWD